MPGQKRKADDELVRPSAKARSESSAGLWSYLKLPFQWISGSLGGAPKDISIGERHEETISRPTNNNLSDDLGAVQGPPKAQIEVRDTTKMIPSAASSTAPAQPVAVEQYGTFVVLGYREALTNDGREVVQTYTDINEEYTLNARKEGNGITLHPEAKNYLAENSTYVVDESWALNHAHLNPGSTVRSITMSATGSQKKRVRLEFVEDKSFDLWQFGRMSQPQNDWQIIGYHTEEFFPMSRYACRIMGCRVTGRCFLYAGGFDEQGDLFLNPSTIRFGNPPTDAFTTCGVLLWTPSTRKWCEISVLGHVYSIRPRYNEAGQPMKEEEISNELTDGCMVHLGGTTLLFRKGQFWRGKSHAKWFPNQVLPSIKALEDMGFICPVEKSQCDPLDKLSDTVPVALHELTAEASDSVPQNPDLRPPNSQDANGNGEHQKEDMASVKSLDACVDSDSEPIQQSSSTLMAKPLVFLNCGHVIAKALIPPEAKLCPQCKTEGPASYLRYAYHPALAMDHHRATGTTTNGAPTVFNPCGHVAEESFATGWANTCVPGICNYYEGQWLHQGRSACPFCSVELNNSKRVSRLIVVK